MQHASSASAWRRRLGPLGQHLRLAWPVFVVFLVQRLLTVAFVARRQGLAALTGRWDAGWYLHLVEAGYVYPHVSPDGRVRASNLAYFPLYPWLVRRVVHADLLTLRPALVVVSWLGGLLAVWAIFAVGHALYDRSTGIVLAALWGMAPASLCLTMGYPEGMFTAAAAGALFFLIRRSPVAAGTCALAAGLLRPSAAAVIVAVGLYFLVELVRWSARRLTGPPGEPSLRPEQRPANPFPSRALAGALVSVLGLGAFMIYVAMRTGEVFGYFTVQSQWGQRTGDLSGWVDGLRAGLFGGPNPAALISVNIAVCVGYLLLFCLVVTDRRLVWASVYAAGLLVMTLSHVTFQHVYARQLLPAFVLLIPLARMRATRMGAIAAITVGSVVMSWGSAQFLLNPASGL